MTTEVINKSVDGLVCIQLDVHIWSGRRHLDKTDLIHANREFAKLPEKDLANLGSVKICDPDKIKKFQSLKNRADTILKRAGLPIVGAIGVPSTKFEQVAKELTDLQIEYGKLATEFVANFKTSVDEWKLKHLMAHPEWERLFRDLPTPEHVGGRLSFAFHPYRISAPVSGEDSTLNGHFEKQIGGLKGELLKEVATEATAFVESLFATNNGVSEKRDFVTPKTLGPLRRAASKLDAFSFIDPEIGPLAGFLQDLLLEMPDEGRIDGQKLISLASVARLMMDQRSIKGLCAVAVNGWSPGDFMHGELPNEVAAAPTATAEQSGAQPGNPTQGSEVVDSEIAADDVTTFATGSLDATSTPVGVGESNDESALCALL